MKRCRALVLLLLISCHVQPPSPAVPVTQQPHALGSVIRPTLPAPLPTRTPTPLPTPLPTAAPTATPTAVPTITATAPAQTGTAAPTVSELADLSLCNQQFGITDSARFSARLERVEIQQLPSSDRLSFIFSALQGTLHGMAGCLRRSEWEQATRTPALADTLIMVDLPDWGHDHAFAVSPLTTTLPLPAGGAVSGIAFRPAEQASRGLTIALGLREALPFHVRVDAKPDRLILDVARSGAIAPAPDPLSEPGGELGVADRPIFFLQNDDVWRWSRGQAAPVLKTDELETALAVSPDHDILAVCRSPAGTDPSAVPYPPASLWLLRADGSDARELANVGGCTEPIFSPNGKAVAFTGNLAAAPPDKRTVWTVPLAVGKPVSVTSTLDEWNRFAPQWLVDGRLIYRASNDSGQTVIFVRETDGHEREVTAGLLTGSPYSGVGAFLLDPQNNTLAVEALRADKPGSDVVFLGLDGTVLAPADGRGYWQRPLVWTPQGLVYLTTECPSAVVQRYTLRLRHGSTSTDLLSGESGAGLGAVVPLDAQILYTRVTTPTGGNRGPAAQAELNTAAALWLMSSDGKLRRQLYRAPVPVVAGQGG